MMYLVGAAIMTILTLFFTATSVTYMVETAQARDLVGFGMALGGLVMTAGPAVAAYVMVLCFKDRRRRRHA